MMMQIYADVLKRELRIAGTAQSAARGCAINASVAAGLFADIPTAVAHYALPDKAYYHPIPENSEAYDHIYAEYLRLHDYFGKGGNDVMMRL
jgi:L-ribulokinase